MRKVVLLMVVVLLVSGCGKKTDDGVETIEVQVQSSEVQGETLAPVTEQTLNSNIGDFDASYMTSEEAESSKEETTIVETSSVDQESIAEVQQSLADLANVDYYDFDSLKQSMLSFDYQKLEWYHNYLDHLSESGELAPYKFEEKMLDPISDLWTGTSGFTEEDATGAVNWYAICSEADIKDYKVNMVDDKAAVVSYVDIDNEVKPLALITVIHNEEGDDLVQIFQYN